MANLVKKYPVPLIFKKILKDRLTGELAVIHDNFTKRLFFRKGLLAYAETTEENERLGEVLLSIGKITKDQLDKLTKIKKHSDGKRKVGEILVDITPLNMHDIYFALLYQIKVIAASTFPLREGEWRFKVTRPEINNTQRFKIKVAEIVAEGIKGLIDMSYYKRRFALRAPVTAPLHETVQRFLTSEQVKFYLKLSTFTNEPIVRIIPKVGIKEDFFWRFLVTLYLLNLVDFVEYTIDEEANKNIEDVNDLYSRVKNTELDFYQLLGIKTGAGQEEIKATYLNYSKRFHPDRIIAAPDSTVKLRANEVFAEINRAFETLSDEEKKRVYDSQGFKEQPSQETERINQTKKAKSLYLNANTHFKQKKYFEASTMMEEAVQRDGTKANYYLLLGLCYSKLPATKNRAETCLKKAANMEPWNADPMFALGELYKSENLLKKADYYFNKALEINMEHTLAGKAKEEMDKMFRKRSSFSLFKRKR